MTRWLSEVASNHIITQTHFALEFRDIGLTLSHGCDIPGVSLLKTKTKLSVMLPNHKTSV